MGAGANRNAEDVRSPVVRDSRFESVHAMVHAVSVKRVKLTVEYI